MDYTQIAISARVTRSDLAAADAALEAGTADTGLQLLLIKQLLLGCANVADLEVASRALYKGCPDLSAIIAPYRRNFEFAKYLRNISVGHVNPSLCAKAVEWRPELNAILADPKPCGGVFIGYALLETAINTFVDCQRHRIFEGDTDLDYPPDRQRFLNTLGETVRIGIEYCDRLGNEAVNRAQLPNFNHELLDLAARAGATEFRLITRKGESGQ